MYDRSGDPSLLDQATSLLQDAILNEEGRPHDAHYYEAKLGLLNALEDRYSHSNAVADLESAIAIARGTLEQLPPDSQRYMRFSYSLSRWLRKHWQRLGRIEDLDESQAILRTIVDATANDPVLRSYNLQYRRQLAFTMMRRIGLLSDRAISSASSVALDAMNLLKGVVAETPQDLFHAKETAVMLLCLCYLFLHRMASRTEHQNYLDLALEEWLKFGDTCPDVPWVQEEFAAMLDRIYEMRLVTSPSLGTWQECLAAKKRFLKLSSSFRTRYETLVGISQLLLGLEEAKEAYGCLRSAVALMPFFVGVSNARDDHEYSIKEASEAGFTIATYTSEETDDETTEVLVSPALSKVALALTLGIGFEEPPESLLAISECGRGIVAASSLPFKTALISGNLSTDYPALFDEFLERKEAAARIRPSPFSVEELDRDLRARIQKNDASRALQETLKKIRDLPGYERFLLSPESKDDFAQLSKDCGGALVYLNVSELGSHAVLITPENLKILPLPDLAFDNVVGNVNLLRNEILQGSLRTFAARSRKFQEVLRWLWNTTVHPVLQELGLKGKRREHSLPRLWWIPAGIMAYLPIHAACDRPDHGVFTYAISSYATTLKALSFCQKQSNQTQEEPGDTEEDFYLLAGMPHTPSFSELPMVESELDGVANAINQIVDCVRVTSPTKDTVMEVLPACSHVHFACHGVSDEDSPSNSGIELQHSDNPQMSDRLTVRDLSEIGRQSKRWTSVFLSACSSADTAVHSLVEESLHLTSEFQMLGFPNVVGTLWPVNDDVSKAVAVGFYRRLAGKYEKRGNVMRAPKDCYAEILQSVMDDLRMDAPENCIQWASFVHFGI